MCSLVPATLSRRMSVQTPKQGLLCGQGEVGFNGAFAGTATPPIHGWYWCGSNAGWERWTRFGTNDNNSVTTQNKTKPLLQSHGTFSLCSRQQSRWLKIFTKSFFFFFSAYDLWFMTKDKDENHSANPKLSAFSSNVLWLSANKESNFCFVVSTLTS